MSAPKAQNLPIHQEVPPEPPPEPPDELLSFQEYSELIIESSKIDLAIGQLPNNKAPGTDKFRAEMLKPVSETLSKWLEPLFNAILRCGAVPSDWNDIIICPIWKGKGLPSDPEKHRPICLAQTIRKVFERTILEHLKEKAGEFNIPQGGFRKERCTFDQAIILDFLIKQQQQESRTNNHWILFLDIKGAFPSTFREKLWEKLRKRGVNEKLIKVLQALQDEIFIKAVVNGKTSSGRWMERGLTQGTVLSPILWNYFIDDLIDILKAETDNQHKSPFFVDDIASLAKNYHQAQRILDAAEKWSNENEVTFEPSKCEAICGKFTLRRLTLYGEPIVITQTFKYLGVMFDKNGIESEKTATKQINATIQRLKQLEEHGINGTTCAASTIILFYKSFLRPIMEYGMQLSTYSDEIIKAMERTQLRCLRSFLSVNSSTTQRGMRLLCGLNRMDVRYQILACRTWSRWIDRQNENSYYSSAAIKILNNIEHECRFESMALWRRMLSKKQEHPNEKLFNTLYLPTEHPQNPHRKITLQETFMLNDMEAQNREKNQELARAIYPAIKPSAVVTAGQPIISRLSRRRLLLWRLGQIPGHIPDDTYRRCEKCYNEQDITVDASRSHVNECLELDNWINPIIERYKPPHWRPPDHPRVYPFDNLLDILTQVGKNPPEPKLAPGVDKNSSVAYNNWLDKVADNNNKVSIIWQHAVAIIDSICSTILGWNSDPYMELELHERI